MKPDNIIYLKCTETSFYRTWIEFLTPFHRLTPREKDVAARILAQYFKLFDSIPDPELRKEVLWSHSSRKDIRESLGLSPARFQMILAQLKSSGFITNGDLNKRFLPHANGEPRFVLGVIFDKSSTDSPVDATHQNQRVGL